ncbi:MAG: hypothetical protein IM577_00130 [Chitinophagaceae bacterium]|nr:hypothetical protein [Chitinophagaceae bacterium]
MNISHGSAHYSKLSLKEKIYLAGQRNTRLIIKQSVHAGLLRLKGLSFDGVSNGTDPVHSI